MKKTMGMVLFILVMMAANVCMAGFSLNGDDIDFDMENNVGVAKGHVVLVQDGGRAMGDYAQFNNRTKTGFLKGNVMAYRNGYHITADTMTVHDNDHTSASGNAVIVKDGKKLKAPLIHYYKARQYLQTENGRAVLTDVDGSTVEADEINYSHLEGLVKAQGKVHIRSDVRKLVASADRAIYRINNSNSVANYLELIGNAKATQDGNTVRGNRLKLNNAKVAQADGRVTIDYTPRPTPVKKKSKQATEEA